MDLLHCVCPADLTLKRRHRVGMKRVMMQRLMSNVPDRIANCQPLLGIERQLRLCDGSGSTGAPPWRPITIVRRRRCGTP